MMRIFTMLVALAAMPLLTPVAEAQDTYRVRSGDVLRVEVLEDSSLNRETLVLPDGRIALPMAGGVAARGKTLEQIQAEVTDRLGPSFAARPTVYVSLSRLAEARGGVAAAPRVLSVYVMGEAAKPGRLELAPGTTLLQAFSAMGGFSKFAATKRVQLRRTDKAGNEKVYMFNYDAMEKGAVAGGSTVLVDGDVIVVPQRRLFE